MIRQNYITVCCLSASLCFAVNAKAQDAHFSQYDAVASITNPALTGMFKGSDFRMSTDLRSQWSQLSSNFLTTAFAYEANVNDQFGFGGYISNFDQAGMLTTFQAGATAAYNVAEDNAPYTLSVGANLGIIYKKVNDADLLFDAQYDDGFFNSDIPSGEFFEKRGRLMPEVSLGIAYRSTNAKKTFNPFANFGVFHVTTPDEAILRVTKADLPIRWSAVLGTHIDVSEELRISPTSLVMIQQSAMQINIGSMGQYKLGNGVYSAIFGAAYRFRDAVIAHVGLKHRNNVYRISYDATTSGLSQFNNNRGAFEFSIVYYGTHSGRQGRTEKQAF